MIRYTRAGKVDRTFGGGKGFVKLSAYHGRPTDVVLDDAGRSVVATEEGLVTRIDPAGRIDPGFNDGQRGVELNRSTNASYRTLAIQPDGKILVAGLTSAYYGPSHIRVARLRPSGKLDRSFGQAGYATVGCHRGRCVPAQILVLGDGRIVLVGTEKAETPRVEHVGDTPSRIVLVRLLPDGQLDRRFGRSGFARLRVTNHSEAKAAVLSPRGILVAGWARPRRGSRALIARFDRAGGLDRRFGEDGISRAFPRGLGKPNALFFAGGHLIVGLNSEGPVAAASFDRDGRRERSFRCPPTRGLMPGLQYEPAVAPQGEKVLLAWSQRLRKRGPTELRLARLTTR